MQNRRNIALVGFMGTGKTTIGTRLAGELGLTFVDMDHVIEERQGKAISRIFAEEGEPFFRNLERQLICELSNKTGLVVGTGGGIVLNPDNTRDLARSGLVVCLMARPDVILKRLEHDTTRPLLAGDKRQKIAALLETRRALYEAIPHRIDTSDLAVDEIVSRILALYQATPPSR